MCLWTMGERNLGYSHYLNGNNNKVLVFIGRKHTCPIHEGKSFLLYPWEINQRLP